MQFAQSDKAMTPINPLNKTCEYMGKTYKNGEGFTSEDGCNSCGCDNGRVACTAMACDVPYPTTEPAPGTGTTGSEGLLAE